MDGRQDGIKFDIALMIGRRFPDRELKEDVFGFVEVKTETNLEGKAEGIEEALTHGNVERSRVDKMSPSVRLLVQVFMQILKERNTATIVMGANWLYLMELDWRTGILMVDGPYFRIPPAVLKVKAFTPVDTMRVVAHMYEALTLRGGRGEGVWEWLFGAAVSDDCDVDTLAVDLLGSRKELFGTGREIRRDGGLAELSLLAKFGRSVCDDGGTGVALGEREPPSTVLGTEIVLRLSGTMVVTPLALLASEYARGLTMPDDDEPAAVERVVERE
ncbi:hypothetical protein NUW54_g2998 [Trametes sanguinea]|uniref:Uncharacterized protein n=1 Tax=Trametes sanguinea TaxID=158606 RepID=A0ACC1Q558_9APHY|nr:hypothetical protein NUW54_g2998 [Trametes sanguinea]